MSSETFVDDCAARLAPLERAAFEAWWDASVDATDAHQQRRAATEVALTDALGDADTFAELRAARAQPGLDASVARQLDVLEQSFAPNQGDPILRREIIQLQSDIDTRFSRHRGHIDGVEVDDNAILAILKSSDDSEHRRAAWEASKSVALDVAADVRRLARLRNDAARSLGYRDFFAMTLATTEFDERKMFVTLEEVDRITAEPFAAMKRELDARLADRFRVDVDDLRPWHYEDPFFQDPPAATGVDLDPYLEGADLEALTVRTYDAMGLDIRDVVTRSDLFPRNGKNQHAFCVNIDRAGDVRVLCNIESTSYWAETMLHEFGHAVYDIGVSAQLPWALRTMHSCVTEGVAIRCGRLVQDPQWLREVAGVAAGTVDTLAPRLQAVRRAEMLVFFRWVLVMIHFERGLYANPDGPHDDRWWDLVERFQLVQRPDGRHAPDWAAKIHIAAAPVYYHNYLFGDLIASQLVQAFGNLGADAGRALSSRVFAPGATMPWATLVEHATGAPLTAAVLARELAV